jgi:hypothetical protein
MSGHVLNISSPSLMSSRAGAPPTSASLKPREHGAYGQITFPALAALLVAGPSLPGVLVVVTMVAGFLAHEPAVVLLGRRGPRARREMLARATRWLRAWTAIGLAAGVGALLAGGSAVRWSMAIPAAFAFLVLAALVGGREKSWYGEVSAALAFSTAALPIAVAAGAGFETAAAIAIPFALLFTTSTLAVRVVILRVRGGGDPHAATATARAALVLIGAGAVALTGAVAGGLLPPGVLITSVPGVLTAAAIALRPPGAAELRTVGWMLIAVSALTLILVVFAAA